MSSLGKCPSPLTWADGRTRNARECPEVELFEAFSGRSWFAWPNRFCKRKVLLTGRFDSSESRLRRQANIGCAKLTGACQKTPSSGDCKPGFARVCASVARERGTPPGWQRQAGGGIACSGRASAYLGGVGAWAAVPAPSGAAEGRCGGRSGRPRRGRRRGQGPRRPVPRIRSRPRCPRLPVAASRSALSRQPFFGGTLSSSSPSRRTRFPGLWKPRSKLTARRSGKADCAASTMGTAKSTSPPCHMTS